MEVLVVDYIYSIRDWRENTNLHLKPIKDIAENPTGGSGKVGPISKMS